jgi:hypothetical protein
MLRVPVPQFVNVEDKIAGPLTWKQLYWMIAMVGILLLMWGAFSPAVFFVFGIPVALAFVAFAFYKPWGQPLIQVVWLAIIFVFRPKQYLWKRQNLKIPHSEPKEPLTQSEESQPIQMKTIKDYAQLLDNPNPELINQYEKVPPKKKRFFTQSKK